MPYSNEAFGELVQARRAEEDEVLQVKGQDYARLDLNNRLRNFEVIADLLRDAPVDATTVCAVYWLKHVMAVCTFVSSRRLESEDIGGRFTDLQNYGYLLEANIKAAEEAARRVVQEAAEGHVRGIKEETP